MIKRIRQPSSTISVATLATLGTSLLWELVYQFGLSPRPALVGASVSFIGALAGYFAPERVLRERWGVDQEQSGDDTPA